MTDLAEIGLTFGRMLDLEIMFHTAPYEAG
jgi:hypothetical protein